VAEPADIDLLAALECAQALDQEDLEMILRRQPDDECIASRDRQLAEDLQAEDVLNLYELNQAELADAQ